MQTIEVEAPRGYRGTMVAPTTLDDESYLDFVQALRGMAIGPVHERAQADARELIAQRGSAGEAAPTRAQIGAIPTVGVRDRLMRSAQEMIWRRVGATYDRNRAQLRRWLADAQSGGTAGRPALQLRESPRYPDYLAEYHLQPGGYHGDELAGFVYHYGTKIFWVGRNDRDQAKTAIVEAVPTPADGIVARVLELACSVGQSTTAFKARFPEAEVWGTDIAAPVLRYAHARASRLGIDVRFAQQPAEELDFPEASFDIVFASLLFHEVPTAVGHEVIRKVARVLRPGGVFVVNDLNPGALEVDEWGEYDRWWDAFHNCEPYEYAFLQSDFTGALKASFPQVDFRGDGYSGQWVARR